MCTLQTRAYFMSFNEALHTQIASTLATVRSSTALFCQLNGSNLRNWIVRHSGANVSSAQTGLVCNRLPIATECALFVAARVSRARELTSLAPADLSSRTIGPIVLPRTIESSTMTMRRPLKFSVRAPNFLDTPNCRSRMLGWMNVLPT